MTKTMNMWTATTNTCDWDANGFMAFHPNGAKLSFPTMQAAKAFCTQMNKFAR